MLCCKDLFYLFFLPPWKSAAEMHSPLTVTTFIFCIFPLYLCTSVHSLCKYYHFTLFLCHWPACMLFFCMPSALCTPLWGKKQHPCVKFCWLCSCCWGVNWCSSSTVLRHDQFNNVPVVESIMFQSIIPHRCLFHPKELFLGWHTVISGG